MNKLVKEVLTNKVKINYYFKALTYIKFWLEKTAYKTKGSYYISIFLAFIFMLSINSCELYNPSEPIPAYIQIDKINLNTTISLEGSSSNKISDAWVYLDDQLIGCFELPAKFPVLFEGKHQIKIMPGIKVNGIAATRAPYPFYSSYDTLIDLQVGTIQNITPHVKYRTNLTFNFMENFENTGTIISKSPAPGVDTVIQQIDAPNPNVFEGNGSGIVYLDKNHTFFEGVSSTSFILPKSGANIFLEFNYKCNNTFVVGLFAHGTASSSKEAALIFNPSANWNKAYVYLTSVVSGNNNASDFNIFFGMINNTSSDSLALMLDNIKLVY